MTGRQTNKTEENKDQKKNVRNQHCHQKKKSTIENTLWLHWALNAYLTSIQSNVTIQTFSISFLLPKKNTIVNHSHNSVYWYASFTASWNPHLPMTLLLQKNQPLNQIQQILHHSAWAVHQRAVVTVSSLNLSILHTSLLKTMNSYSCSLRQAPS